MKSQIVLYIYEKLLLKEKVTTNELLGEFDVSVRTIRRYISEINAYLFNFNKGKEVVFNKTRGTYILKDI